MGHEKHTWHLSCYFKALKVSACASGHGQKMPDTQVLRLPTDGPSGFPAPTPVRAYLTHLSYRSLTSLKLEASRHRLLGLPVCPCGFQIVLLHLFVFFFPPSCFTSVFPSPPPALLTSDSSFSVRSNSHTSTS